MIFQSLCKLAEDEGLVREGLEDYDQRPVKYLLRVGPGGEFLGFQVTEGVSAEAGKPPAARHYWVPAPPNRTGADVPGFLVDKAEYVLGVGTKDASKLAHRRRLFLQVACEAARETADSAVCDVREFLVKLESGELRPIASEELVVAPPDRTDSSLGSPLELPADFDSQASIAFVHASDPESLVSSRVRVREYFSKRRAAETLREAGASARRVCLVCGVPRAIERLHPKIGPVPGATKPVPLVSFNQDAFESFGLTQSFNAPVCSSCADAYTKALKRLLSADYPHPETGHPLPRRNFRLGAETVAVFWSEENGETLDVFEAALGRAEPEAVAALFGSPWKGRLATLDDPSVFRAVVLSGAEGRATIRGVFESSVAAVVGFLRHHFEDLRIVALSAQPRPLSLHTLVGTLSPPGRNESTPPDLAAQLFRCAFTGEPYPTVVPLTVVRRLRSERKFWTERLALLKAWLNRRRRLAPEAASRYREVEPTMDSENPHPAYRLGRLLAVLERLQGAAIRNASTTIVDRFYGAASATPAVVFPRLMRQAQHHLSKVGGGYYTALISEVVQPLKAFPRTLDLEGQGLFALGYYQQRAELWKKKEDARESSDGLADATTIAGAD